MSTTVSLPRRSRTSHRTQILAWATALVAAASVAVTLAVAGDDGGTAASQPSARSSSAIPDRATQYRNETALPSEPARQAGGIAADRFHHFR
jgi:hypothetical protein